MHAVERRTKPGKDMLMFLEVTFRRGLEGPVVSKSKEKGKTEIRIDIENLRLELFGYTACRGKAQNSLKSKVKFARVLVFDGTHPVGPCKPGCDSNR